MHFFVAPVITIIYHCEYKCAIFFKGKVKMEQRTTNWLDWRKAGLGASDAPIVMGVSPWSTPHQLWEQKTGRLIKDFSNWATQRGNDMEPRARAHLELKLGLDFPAILSEHPKLSFMRASLDGWNEEKKIVLEIKCPGKDDHEKAKNGEVPEKYYPQLQHQLFVTGASLAYYYSYTEDENKNGIGYLVEVEPNKEYIAELLDKMMKFWKCVQGDIEPELTDKDYKCIRNSEIHGDLKAWKEAKDNLAILEKRVEALKAKVLEHPELKGIRARVGDFRISVTHRKGNIQYAKIPELSGLDVEKYRAKPSTYQSISYKEPKCT